MPYKDKARNDACKKAYKKTEAGKASNNRANIKIRLRNRTMMDKLKINGCSICGYNKCNDALSFHHVNPENKLFNMMMSSLNYSNENIADEINKCILLCANCHREIHHKERENMLKEKQDKKILGGM